MKIRAAIATSVSIRADRACLCVCMMALHDGTALLNRECVVSVAKGRHIHTHMDKPLPPFQRMNHTNDSRLWLEYLRVATQR